MSVIGRVFNFFKESRTELSKVNWPSRSNVIRNTILIIISILLATAIVGVFDILLIKLVQLFVVK